MKLGLLHVRLLGLGMQRMSPLLLLLLELMGWEVLGIMKGRRWAFLKTARTLGRVGR